MSSGKEVAFQTDPPEGRDFAMAYARSSGAAARPTTPAQTRAWEDLRREARKLETDLDTRLASYAKLCSSFDTGYGARGETGLATEQFASSKATEIQGLLNRLSDANEEMSGLLSGGGDSRSHTLARHRDILHDFMQEFRRLNVNLGAARDRADLFAGGSATSIPSMGGQGSSGLLLRERGALQGANTALDDVMGQAQSVAGSLTMQRRLFGNIGSKLSDVAARFPVVNNLLSSIRRRKNRDTIILSAVIIACALFTIIYWLNK
ncbi:hypothetical protein WJX84_006699 [Apatococcus fuscideae]|uniref:Golgi SNAP receptor complex member 1 n=1 Tax=Apatococcus fuscideae TaxID=2026836 RepID=A0AAW1SYM1_9CHLO